MKKSYFLVEIESEYEVDAETLQSNIYYRFPTSVESVKVEAVKQPLKTDFSEMVLPCEIHTFCFPEPNDPKHFTCGCEVPKY